MGVMDITQKEFFTDDERFADFVNAVYFGGRRVVKLEELKDVPETARKADGEAVLERTCDVIKKCTKDGATSLRELVEVPVEDEQLREIMLEMLPDYKIRVYDLNKETDFSAFQTNLRTVFEFYARHNNGKAMKEYMEEHREDVETLDEESRFFLSKMLKDRDLTKLLKHKEKRNRKKEETGMCKAIDELREMSRQEGIAQGRAEREAEFRSTLAKERGIAEKTIHALQQEIENLKKQLIPKVH